MTQNSAFTSSLWEEFDEIDIADIIVDVEAPDLHPSYSYRVPERLLKRLQVGVCVQINFHGRETLGYVIDRRKISRSDPLIAKLREIKAVVEDAVTINIEQIETIRWMSQKYLCTYLDALRCVAPAILGAKVVTSVRFAIAGLRGADVGSSVPQAHLVETLHSLGDESELETLRQAANLPQFSSAYSALLEKKILTEVSRVSRAKTVYKKIRAYRSKVEDADLNLSGRASKRTPAQERILLVLKDWERKDRDPMPQMELLRRSQVQIGSLKPLVDRGLIQIEEVISYRRSVKGEGTLSTPPILTLGQKRAVRKISACLQSRDSKTVLLFGVTASGKTEVYLQAIDETLKLGKSVIVLVPEIALTAQVADIFVGRFGEQVAVLHSKLSDGERHDEWRRMQEGLAKIVVGARSAIFAPLTNVGLIVVDEEHEASYKQEKTPRYNAKELAAERARLSKATLLLGSATPSLESYYAATERQEDPFELIEMPQRIDNRPLPGVEIVDQREEFKHNKALFSIRLSEAIEKRLALKQQTILYLNRRGFAQFVLCRDCGWTSKCPNCSVSLAFHAYERTLKCHHCDYMSKPPLTCPDCNSSKVKAFGIGTEKVEEEVLRLFPTARVARMDRDTTAKKGEHSRIIRNFRQGDADILIGTQMVAKGLDFPNVTLVGVISADTSINLPDFRAAERTFQLLTQVAGRAGRGETEGEVIVQTFNPEHYSIVAAQTHDYRSFYEQEIQFRSELKYPPFCRFANLICVDENESKASAKADLLASALERTSPAEVERIGPSPAPLARLKNQFRYHVTLRAPVNVALENVVRAGLGLLPSTEKGGIQIDMDPLSMA